MSKIFKLDGLNTKLENCLKRQLKYFNIQERIGGLDSDCWIKLGHCMSSDIIAKNKAHLDEDKGWINFIGFSRIDGHPIFYIPDNEFFNPNAKQIFSVLTDEYIGGPYAEFINVEEGFQEVQRLEDTIKNYFPIENPIVERVFSELDPYGEENWEK